MDNLSREQLREAMLAEYKEVGNNFRTLTDIRFKLLGFLPVGKLFLDWFKAQRTARRKTMREQAKEAVERLGTS